MNVNELDVKKTGLLFFDMLNVYYRGASEETQKRMKPVVDNAVRLMNAARQIRYRSSTPWPTTGPTARVAA